MFCWHYVDFGLFVVVVWNGDLGEVWVAVDELTDEAVVVDVVRAPF